jgi:hypothetical protein
MTENIGHRKLVKKDALRRMANIKKSWQNVRVGMSEFDNKVILLEFFD